MPPAPENGVHDRAAVARLRAIGRWAALFAAVLDAADAALLPGAGRAVRVLVPNGDLSRARELLATSAAPAEDDDVAAAPEQVTRSWALRWLIVALALAAIAALVL